MKSMRSITRSPSLFSFSSSSSSPHNKKSWAPFFVSLLVTTASPIAVSSNARTFTALFASAQHQQSSSVRRLHRKQQKRQATMSHRETASERAYAPYRKHPQLFGDTFRDEWLHPDMQEMMKRLSDNVTATTIQQEESTTTFLRTLSPLLREEARQIYSFECLSPSFLELFREELNHFSQITEQYNIPVNRPNSMNNYGVILNDIGMRHWITDFQQRFLWPLASRLFPRQALPKFDNHHSFIVRYQANEDLGLDMHIDDSDVTFNVCLGEPEFTGATLVFCGDFGAPEHRHVSHTYHHQVGRAVVHLGSRRHGAEDIEAGTRINWILWSHNSHYRQSDEYRRLRNMHGASYQAEQGPPDPLCLSYTHDRDYTKYKTLPNLDLHVHPWCPPPGKEYPGYFATMPEMDIFDGDNGDKNGPKKSTTPTRREPQSQDEL